MSEPLGTCRWFLYCPNEATSIVDDRTLGSIPVCDSCRLNFVPTDTLPDIPEPDWSLVDLSPKACVARGMAYLQANYIKGRVRINLRLLDIGYSTDCVLGQMFGHYEDSPECLNHSRAWMVAHGFLAGSPVTPNPLAWCEALNEEWRSALEAWYAQ